MVSSISTNQLRTVYNGVDNGLPILNPQKPGSGEFLKAMSELKKATTAFLQACHKRSCTNSGNVMKKTRPNLENALQRAKTAIEALKDQNDIELRAAILRGEQAYRKSYHALSHH